jgi:pyrroloquinoline-quinone synthase
MAVLGKINEEIEKRSLLKHEFYVMWSEGKLTKDHLAGYSKEYFQLVKAVPKLVENIASLSRSIGKPTDDVDKNLRDEVAHIALWKGFSDALGVKPEDLNSYAGNERTRKAVSSLVELTGRSYYQGVAALYALEKQIPKISREKIEGLRKFYGIDGQDATEYFRVHEKDDVRHVAVWEAILNKVPASAESAMVEAAIQSMVAQNQLLDSVMEEYVRQTNVA